MGIGIGQNWRESIYYGIPGVGDGWRIQTLTPGEWERLIDTAGKRTLDRKGCMWVRSQADCLRDELCMRLFVECGLWVDEVGNVRYGDFRQGPADMWSLDVHPTESSRPRTVNTSAAIAALVEQLQAMPGNGQCKETRIFGCEVGDDDDPQHIRTRQFIGHVMADLMVAAGLRAFRASVYTLRNTFFDHHIQSGGDVESLLDAIGLDCRETIEVHLRNLDLAKKVSAEWT